jgi:AraC family transcriptional regulator of arabinose operon
VNEIGLVQNHSTNATPDRQIEIMLPANVVESICRTQPLLRGLLATGAGFSSKAPKQFRQQRNDRSALLIYCVRGRGWCETDGRLHVVRKGDLLVLPPDKPFACGTHRSNPWTIHWVQATGVLLRDYVGALPVAALSPVRNAGDDLQLARLFSEILDSLRRGTSFAHLLHASSILGYLMSLLIQRRRENPRGNSDAVNKVAETIIYMSDHLDEPLRVPALARMASLSPAYFGELFKEQTGCSPRDYLHLLRIHRACRMLQGTELNVKEIAGRLGYQDQFHFSRQFKAFQGLSPSDYRRAGSH